MTFTLEVSLPCICTDLNTVSQTNACSLSERCCVLCVVRLSAVIHLHVQLIVGVITHTKDFPLLLHVAQTV